jgi:hypothetical protein
VTQGGTCTAFTTAAALGWSYSDSDVVVPACGPRPYPAGPKDHVYPYPTAPRWTPGYQCVELSERFLYYKYAVAAPSIYTDGDQIVDHYAAKYPSLFSVEDASQKVPLEQGDVISFAGDASFDDPNGDGGHTAVVQSSTVDAAGNGTVTVIQENASADGHAVYRVAGWAIQGTKWKYIKWLHYKSSPLTPPGSGGTTSSHGLDLVFAIDTTGSMSPYIGSVVASAAAIVAALDASGVPYRVGIVDYKDADNGCGDYDAVTDLPFSSNKTAIETAFADLIPRVAGGCDIPEDVYSGVDRALNFPWQTGVAKAVIVMGDAPGHDPEAHSGLTLAKIVAHAAAVDPAQVYSVLVGSDAYAHAFDQALADATGGVTFDATADPSAAGPAFVQAVTKIASALQPTQTALTLSTTNVQAGMPTTLTATVSPAPTDGEVAFADNGNPILACEAQAVDATGTATCIVPFAAPGDHALTATYSGDATLDWSESAPQDLSVVAPRHTLTLVFQRADGTVQWSFTGPTLLATTPFGALRRSYLGAVLAGGFNSLGELNLLVTQQSGQDFCGRIVATSLRASAAATCTYITTSPDWIAGAGGATSGTGRNATSGLLTWLVTR